MAAVTEAQRKVLANLAAGRDPFGHVYGRAARGGAEQTLAALRRRGLVTQDGDTLVLTDTGREALR